VAVVTHVLERKPLSLLDKSIQSLHNVAPHLIVVIGCVSRRAALLLHSRFA
jgi:hypothetical protein